MFQQLLERVGTALDRAGLSYMVIGGQAVLLYGEPRLTKDVDITVGADLDRLHEVLQAARSAGLEPLVDPEKFTRETMVLPCRDPGSAIRVDLILSFSRYEQEALSRVRRVPMGAASVRFASPEDVIVHKIVAGRPRDLEDVGSLVRRNPDLDRAYIERWLGEIRGATGEPYVQRFRDIASSG